LFKIIEAACMDADREYIVCDMDHGSDFRITKTRQGPHNNYGTSTFGIRQRPLGPVEVAGVTHYGLTDLKAVLGEAPTQDAIDMMLPLYRDAWEGRPFDTASYGTFYRAYAARDYGKSNTTAIAAPAANVVMSAVKTAAAKAQETALLTQVHKNNRASATA
jgi:hypothetical protein